MHVFIKSEFNTSSSLTIQIFYTLNVPKDLNFIIIIIFFFLELLTDSKHKLLYLCLFTFKEEETNIIGTYVAEHHSQFLSGP